MTIEEMAAKYHWVNIAPNGTVELFLDHHTLSSFRTCEAYFELSILNRVKRKGIGSWNLEFGQLYHKMVEKFYQDKIENKYEVSTFVDAIIASWDEMKMDKYAEHKNYITLGGLTGFTTMLLQYADHFSLEVDRLRIIAIEVPFGKDREVPLGLFYRDGLSVECYLTGRIDFLMDSGNAIGPLDHKTTAFFKGNPADTYDPQDGMTGYVFATRKIIEQFFPEFTGRRKVDRIWINSAQVTPVRDNDPLKRFKRTPIFKTDYQLEEYRLRQLSTFRRIFDFVLSGDKPQWSTDRCSNMFFKDCQYKELHRQNTSSAMLNVLNIDFEVGEEWNPENL